MALLSRPPILRPAGRARSHPVAVTAVVAAATAVAFLLAPVTGRDLAAQVARGEFWARHGGAVWDLGWYGGHSPFGYSLLTPAPMAWLGAGTDGPRRLGAIAALLAAVAFAALLRRTGARRPLSGGVLGVAGIFGNLVSGRVTFTVGLVFGLAALLAVADRPAGASRLGTAISRPFRLGAAISRPFRLGAAISRAFRFGVAVSRPFRLGAAVSRPFRLGAVVSRPFRFGVAADSRYFQAGAAAAGWPVRLCVAGVAAGLAGAASPVAGLFTGLAGTAMVMTGTRRAGGLVIGAGAGAPLLVTGLLFGANGPMNTIPADSLRAISVGVLVAAVAGPRVLRVGALLSAAGVLVASLLATPVGLNAGRLSATFALGVLAAYGWAPRSWPPVAKVLPLLVVAAWQHPVAFDELRRTADPMSDGAYYAPLTAELARRAPVGRVEIPASAAYWEAAYVPRAVPLARGWLRQADMARNPVFFDGTLTAGTYEKWLRDNGVSYVAVAHAPTAWPGRAEAGLIRTGQPYLTRVWQNRDWTLYAVQGEPSVVSGATLVAATDAALTVDAPAAGDVTLRVHWSRWLASTGPAGCLTAGPDGWTTLRVAAPGRYAIAGALRPSGRC